MLAAIAHRGPDDHGLQSIRRSESVIFLGNARLSILDLTQAGHQPMYDPDTGNWIIYNGEVYNFHDLKKELESLGCTFSSATDTEVVLKAYAFFGPACAQRLRGMYAFAVWDARNDELFICRDRAGEKPLYYFSSPRVFVFASEVRAILASGVPERKLDADGLELYLTNGFLISPHTLVAGIRSLLAGHWMRVSASGQILETRQYWGLSPTSGQLKRNVNLDETREYLRDAVRRRLISDVPLGAFLSGGLDSSMIVALMSEAGGEVRTFSVVFDETDFDESKYSRWVAKRFRTNHTEVRLTENDFGQMFRSALAAMDQPTFDGINTYCVAKAAKDAGLKVALSGAGADELFGGYELFNWVRSLGRIRPLLAAVPYRAVRFMRDRLSRNAFSGASGAAKLLDIGINGSSWKSCGQFLAAAYQATQILLPSWSRRALVSLEYDSLESPSGLPDEFLNLLRTEIGEEDADNIVSKLAFRIFLGERCLRDIDFMSMGVSLEVRAPFVDHVLVESLYRFSGELRCSGSPDKPFLQEIAKPILGPQYPRRKKHGFFFPLESWLDRVFDSAETQDIIYDSDLIERLGFRKQMLSLLFEQFRMEKRVPWSRAWAIFVLLFWCQMHRITR